MRYKLKPNKAARHPIEWVGLEKAEELIVAKKVDPGVEEILIAILKRVG